MCKKRAVVYLILFLTVLMGITAESSALYISQSLTSHYSYDLENEAAYNSYINYQLEMDKRIDLGSYFGSMHLNPELNYNFSGDWDIAIKEAYIDLYIKAFDFRMGRQYVNWGRADGLIVTNLINPEDFSNYPVINFNDRFQAMDILKVNYYRGMSNFEFIWMPKFTGANIEDEHFISRLTEEMELPVEPEIDDSQKEPETKLKNSEFAFRYSKLGRNLDYELLAAYLWDNYPVYHFDASSMPPVIMPEHHRYWALGGSLSTTYSEFLVKGETLFAGNKIYNADPREVDGGTVEKDSLTWMLGAEYAFSDYMFAVELRQEYLFDYEKEMIQDEFNTQINTLLQGNFLRNTLESSINMLYDLNNDFLKAKSIISYDYRDDVKFKMGLDYVIKEGKMQMPEVDQDVVFLQTEIAF